MNSIIFLQEKRWTKRSKLIVKNSASLISDLLSFYTDLTPEETFDKLFPNCHMWFSSVLKGHALAMWGNIRFLNNDIISASLVIHEFGHLLCVALDNKPLAQLAKDLEVLILNLIWEGSHPKSVKGYLESDVFANLFEIWILGLAGEDEMKVLNAWFNKWLAIWIKGY